MSSVDDDDAMQGLDPVRELLSVSVEMRYEGVSLARWTFRITNTGRGVVKLSKQTKSDFDRKCKWRPIHTVVSATPVYDILRPEGFPDRVLAGISRLSRTYIRCDWKRLRTRENKVQSEFATTHLEAERMHGTGRVMVCLGVEECAAESGCGVDGDMENEK